MSNVVVTGANGFVGRELIASFRDRNMLVRALVREAAPATSGVQFVAIGDMATIDDWRPLLEGSRVVVHLAGRVHRMDRGGEAIYTRENTEVTRRIALAAVETGVRQLVYLSTIKVNGERTAGVPFRSTDSPLPLDAYSRSKLAAEKAIAEVVRGSTLTSTVIRPPLVYGPQVRANFRRLMTIVAKGIPLPLELVDNRRSMVSIWNLIDLIHQVLEKPAQGTRTFLVADEESLSTPDLLRRIGRAMRRHARLFPFPVGLLRGVASAFGRGAEARRLTDSLEVDSEPTQRALNWKPPVSVDEGLARTVAAYLGEIS